ncbi:hypothetical protein [Streptomyces daghestanicus]|uniref:Uncharacterized protein n=1 Tax=Streptomyces daghestanicus TaxID=66885 RepID=A0ABQ3Q7J9_9ACTN|nr:hypothetical protein [Streptomyces daghestanicus]GGU66375.1 hypothetical protein GCM10010259_65820 [Streptomyces daghestanicus]GHI33234.1 hypothetical protein Sdagh_49640 [Streptomyces daghestanicus]
MTAERRLTSEELVRELRSALDADTGWLPALCVPNGPAGLPADAKLEAVVERLLAFASAPEVPAAVAPTLQRAADAADMALVTVGAARYHHVGMAYAYLTQAQGFIGRDGQ